MSLIESASAPITASFFRFLANGSRCLSFLSKKPKLILDLNNRHHGCIELRLCYLSGRDKLREVSSVCKAGHIHIEPCADSLKRGILGVTRESMRLKACDCERI